MTNPAAEPSLPESLVLSGHGAVRLLTINRPDRRNALDDAERVGLVALMNWFEAEPSASVLVITGAGGAFSAGGDIGSMQRLHDDPAYRDQSMREAQELVEVMLGLSKPVIAAVNGPAVGLGCTLTQLCDVVLVAESAWFADPHVSVGLVAGDGGALLWPMVMGPLRAKRYLFTGDRVLAVDAVRLGLATELVDAAGLFDAAMSLARRLADQPQQALRDTKRVVNLPLVALAASVMPFSVAAEGASAASDDFAARLAEQGRATRERP
jgi:enoyl-CoA hydratase